MKRLFYIADRYIKESDWRDLALIKFCLCAIGVIIGVSIPKEKKSFPLFAAVTVFVATYIPLMIKFFKICAEVVLPRSDNE